MRRFERMKKTFRILLSLCLVLQYMPTTAFADNSCDRHDPGEEVIENNCPADCINGGSYDTVVYCKECGEELSRETTFVPVTGQHTPGDPEVHETDPGCDYDGCIDTVVDCKICGERLSFESTTIPQTGHTPGEESIYVLRESSCTEEGEEQWVVYCTACGTEIDDGERPVAKTAHRYEEETIPPTHTEDGYTIYTCLDCMDSYTGDTVDATGHDSVNGLTYSDNGEGTHDVYCPDCDEVVQTATCVEFDENHKCIACEGLERMSITFMNGEQEWASSTIAYGSTLGIAGMPIPEAATGYKFAGWYTEDETFVHHGMTVTDHLVAYATWEAETYTVTWVSDEETYVTASVKYGDTITVPEEPTKEGYHFVEWDTEIPATMPTENLTITAVWEACSGGTATCTDKAVCYTCEKAYGEIDSANHAGGTRLENAKDATCGADGYTGDTCCKGCGKVVTEGTVIKATGNHTYGDWKVVKEATKTTKGEKQRTCSVCEQVESKEIPRITDTPATGDTSDIMLYGYLFMVSLAVIVALSLVSKKRRHENA